MALREEQETTITFNEADGTALVWSASPVFQRHMVKQGIEPTREYTGPDGLRSYWYEIPKKWVKIRKPRVLTEEQKERARESGRRLALASRRKGD